MKLSKLIHDLQLSFTEYGDVDVAAMNAYGYDVVDILSVRAGNVQNDFPPDTPFIDRDDPEFVRKVNAVVITFDG